MAWFTRQSAEEIAARFWVNRHSGSWNEFDAEAFERWVQAAPEHRYIYDRVAAVCELARRVPIAPLPPQTESPAGLLFSNFRRLAVAVVVCAIFIGGWRQLGHWWNGTPITWTAESNAPLTVDLSDGSRIELDAGTQLITQWGARARHASLLHGEALFSVSHDSTRPLSVDVGRGHIRDVGTVFDVETLDDSVKVSVLRGSVGVRTRRGEVVLSAGQGSGFEGTGELLPVTRVADSVASWRDGIRHFDSVALTDVLNMLSRRHGVTLSVSDAATARLRLSGTLRVDDLALSLRTLGTALRLQVRWSDEHHAQLSRKGSGNSGSAQPDGG